MSIKDQNNHGKMDINERAEMQALPDAEFRRFIVDKLLELQKTDERNHRQNVEALKRIEQQTRLARNVQNISKAGAVLYEAGAVVARGIIKIIAAVVVVYAVIYVATHEGHLPEWTKSLLSLVRSD